jgi:Co/Zn/Cd efflux system component
VVASDTDAGLVHEVAHELHERFDIDHATIQLEPRERPDGCRLDPDGGCGC